MFRFLRRLRERFGSPQYPIVKLLHLSIAHLPDHVLAAWTKEYDYCGELEVEGVKALDYDGWQIYVHEFGDGQNTPPELRILRDYGKSRGCVYLMLDECGPYIEGLPLYNTPYDLPVSGV